ncbi:hypothetical protein IDH44_00465 [Paenibacillus sp. IB182496]|uniref:Uncharacterized protein n=1 Tax=Paenibacillus sabuli TaxID=2772509 RepID=A0A927GPW2_9BACL|nr:hypothetical protein [Paenibacillus sabuli]MBD2843646.1 hypothetical protein [Paenibacillus sabuli]
MKLDEKWMKQGIEQGKKEAALELMQDLGAVSDQVKLKILKETKADQLKYWLKLAAKAQSMDEFVRLM